MHISLSSTYTTDMTLLKAYMQSTNVGKSYLQDAVKGHSVTKERTGGGFIALCIYNLGTRWRREFSTTPRPLYPQEGETVPILQEVGWASGPVRTSSENLAFRRLSNP
jgi:hypothetical protein